MWHPSDETLATLRRDYPAGTRIELIEMWDFQASPVGTQGTVLGVDDMGDLLVNWDTGSSLKVVYGVDRCRKLQMTVKVHEQLVAIRDSGETNMFDIATVQRLAFERDFYELVLFIEEHRKEYIRFILTGHEE